NSTRRRPVSAGGLSVGALAPTGSPRECGPGGGFRPCSVVGSAHPTKYNRAMRIPGLFITGTGTGVGKSYVAQLIARQLVAEGRRVGVYKPVASGCRPQAGVLVSDDALVLWEAARKPGELERVCPQRFA